MLQEWRKAFRRNSDKFLLNYIAEFVKFVQVDGGKFFELSIKELLEDKNSNLR